MLRNHDNGPSADSASWLPVDTVDTVDTVAGDDIHTMYGGPCSTVTVHPSEKVTESSNGPSSASEPSTPRLKLALTDTRRPQWTEMDNGIWNDSPVVHSVAASGVNPPPAPPENPPPDGFTMQPPSAK